MTTGRPPARRQPLRELRERCHARLRAARQRWNDWRCQEVTRVVLPDGRVKKTIITKPPGGAAPWAGAPSVLPSGWRTGVVLIVILLLVAVFGEGLCNRGQRTRMMTGVELEKMEGVNPSR